MQEGTMKFTLVFVVKHDDGRVTEEVVAIGECLAIMPEAFEEMYASRYVHYECRPYNGENVGDVTERTCHFEWSLADNGWADHTCSNCGYVENTDIHVSLSYDHCPNCGARIE